MVSPRIGVSPGLHASFPSLPVVRPPYDGTWMCTLWLKSEYSLSVERAYKRIRPWVVRDEAEARQVLQHLRDAGVAVDYPTTTREDDPPPDGFRDQ